MLVLRGVSFAQSVKVTDKNTMTIAIIDDKLAGVLPKRDLEGLFKV